MSDPNLPNVENAPNNPNQGTGGAQLPTPPRPPRLPSGDGFRDGEFRVSEPVANFFEKLLDTVAYVVTLVAALVGRALRFIGELVLSILELPAKALMLFPYGKHMLTLGARSTIIVLGLLIVAISVWDFFIWSKTWAYIFTEERTINFASAILAVFTLLVERSFALMPTDKSMVRHTSWISKLMGGYALMSAARIAILLILSIANGEAMRVQLSRDEIDHVIALQEAKTNRQLHERRAAEIQTEMTRRRAEVTAQAQSDLTALTQRRQSERAQTARGRSESTAQQRADIRAQDDIAERERNAPGRRGVGTHVRDIRTRQQTADTALQDYERATAETLGQHDRETAEAQAQLSNQTATRNAALNTEQDRRLEELRHMTMDQLAGQYGVHARRANGFWARRDALEVVHERSPSSKHGDWFAMVVLVGIGMLLFVAKKTAPHDVVVYYNVQAHAFADDDSPFCAMAKQTYAAMVQDDSGAQGLQHDYLTACEQLKREYANFLAKIADIAQSVDETGLHYPLPVAVTAVERAWFDSDARVSTLTESTAAVVTEQPSWPIRLFRYFWKPAPKQPAHSMSMAQHLVLDMEFSASRARISLPVHLASYRARSATSTVTREELEAQGWKDPAPALYAREGLKREHEGHQQALVDSLLEFQTRFGRVIRTDDLKDAESEYLATIRRTELELTRCHQRFVNMKVDPPAWIYDVDPRVDARNIGAIFFRPVTPPPPLPPRTSLVEPLTDAAPSDPDADEDTDFPDSNKSTSASSTGPKLVVYTGGANDSSSN